MDIVKDFEKLLEEVIKNPPKPKYDEIHAFLVFTPEEVEKMGAKIASLMTNKWDRTIFVTKRRVKNGFVYILHVHKDGVRIEIIDKDLRRAKQRFIRASHKRRGKKGLQLLIVA